MTISIRRWRQSYRYRTTLRSLRALSNDQLKALWIRPNEVSRLAWKASSV